MRILLVAMPDTASSLDRVMKFPNLGLCSLAAQVPEHEVRILDLVLRPRGVRRQVLDEVAAFGPDQVGSRDGEVFDFIVRGEGELAVRQLVDILTGAGGGDLARVPGLSWRDR